MTAACDHAEDEQPGDGAADVCDVGPGGGDDGAGGRDRVAGRGDLEGEGEPRASTDPGGGDAAVARAEPVSCARVRL